MDRKLVFKNPLERYNASLSYLSFSCHTCAAYLSYEVTEQIFCQCSLKC